MIRRFATPLALGTAAVIYVMFFLLLTDAAAFVQVGVPALLAAGAASGVMVMLGRTPREISDAAYHDDAAGQMRAALDTVERVRQASRSVASPTVRADVDQIGRQVRELLTRTQAEAATSLYSSASVLHGHLTSLLGVVTQFSDIEKNPSFYRNAPELLAEGGEAVRRFRDFTLESIRLINAGSIAEYRANLDTVAPPTIPVFGGDA